MIAITRGWRTVFGEWGELSGDLLALGGEWIVVSGEGDWKEEYRESCDVLGVLTEVGLNCISFSGYKSVGKVERGNESGDW